MNRQLEPLPTPSELSDWIGPELTRVCRKIAAAGGQPRLVGGAVRDWLLGNRSGEFDFEIRELGLDALREVLATEGELIEVGRSFGVLRLRHIDADFGLPRRDSRRGVGHRGIHAEVDPWLDPVIAARRRDLTINSLGLDPLSGELTDPLDGLRDLRAGSLRACDPETFGEDPLRALRVMQLSARLEMEADELLYEVCAGQDLTELSGERVFGEFRKLLLRSAQPSRGLAFLRQTGLLRYFPSLAGLVGVPQDPKWHPEGDVWIHTLMVVDAAAALRDGCADDEALMFGALCHDFGKAVTTVVGTDGRVRSPGHDIAGETIGRSFMAELRAPSALNTQVRQLTREHLAPAILDEQGSSDRAWRRLARRMAGSGASLELLARLARADHLGRTTPEALRGEFAAGDRFLARARKLGVDASPPADVVQGRHLLALGMESGPEIGDVLECCRKIQDETGWTDPEQILARALNQE